MVMNKFMLPLIGLCALLCGGAPSGAAETPAEKRVTIEGAVKQPGEYVLAADEQLMAIIGRAGGTTRLSNRKVYIVRGEGDALSVYITDVDKLRIDRKDYPLFSGDRLFMPSRD